jgi:hypothetical protein
MRPSQFNPLTPQQQSPNIFGALVASQIINTGFFMKEFFSGVQDFETPPGCAYMIEEAHGRRPCGAARRPSSSYCPHHHSLCYLVSGSAAETHRLREVEALASAVGGRRARRREAPTRQFLKRLEEAVREVF